MNKTVAITIGLLGITVAACGQYKLDECVYTYPQKINFRDVPFEKVLFKKFRNNAFLYEEQPGNDTDSVTTYQVKKISLGNGHLSRENTFQIPKDFLVKDILPLKRKTVVLSYGKALIVGKSTVLIQQNDTDFRYGLVLNDSLVLLYTLYNYHPADGRCGLHMNVLNVNNCRIIKSVVYRFPGVGAGFMTVNWLTSDKEFIYAFAGLTGRIFKYDFNLNQISERSISIFQDADQRSNLAYEHSLDSVIYNDWQTIRKEIDNDKKLGIKRRYSSAVHTKEFIIGTSNELRKTRPFIEKIFALEGSEIIFTVSIPGYGYNYRDVYLYDLHTNSVSLKYKKWHCAKLKEINSPEDYFTVDLVNDITIAPFFYKNYVYAPQFYNLGLFKKGTAESLDELHHNDVMKNGYKWQLVKFRL